MNIHVCEEPIERVSELTCISIAFQVRSIFDVIMPEEGLQGIHFVERSLEEPYVKDYDAIDGDGPGSWTKRFNLTNWGLIGAYRAGERIGAAVIAFDTPGVNMLKGRDDLAVLWDLRVASEMRGQGVGAALFDAAEAWVSSRGCRRLDVETQNINVPACRFYVARGCTLSAVDRFAYGDLPHEAQLIWTKFLDMSLTSGPTPDELARI